MFFSKNNSIRFQYSVTKMEARKQKVLCDICGQYLKNGKILKVHMKNIHGLQVPPSKPEQETSHVSPVMKLLITQRN